MSLKKDRKKRPESPLPIDHLERNTLTLSLVVVILGLMCLPNIEKGRDTWYVLMIVFGINVVLIGWVISRIVGRVFEEKRNKKK